MDAWNPTQYERFKKEREQPGRDLIALVQSAPGLRIVDLGCGTGELTQELHQATQAAHTLGLDSSEKMLELAAARAGHGLEFGLMDAAKYAPTGTQPDVIFSNACLMWISGHAELFARLWAALAPGGQLAVQMPDMAAHPCQMAAKQVAESSPFREALGGFVYRHEVHPLEWYSELFFKLGAEKQNLRIQIYPHVLPSREDIVEWVKGALLTPYQKKLNEELYAKFLEAYRQELFRQVPDQRPILYPYRRYLMWARKTA